jgi:hypothetical protein
MCKKAFGGLILQPYLYTAVSCLLFFILKDLLWASMKDTLRSLYKYYCPSKPKSSELEEGIIQLSERSESEMNIDEICEARMLKIIHKRNKKIDDDNQFVVFTICISILSLIWIAIHFEHGKTFWQGYRNFSAAVLYSPVLTPVFSVFLRVMSRADERYQFKLGLKKLLQVGSSVRVMCRDISNPADEIHPTLDEYFNQFNYNQYHNAMELLFQHSHPGHITSINPNERLVSIQIDPHISPNKTIRNVPLVCVQFTNKIHDEVIRLQERDIDAMSHITTSVGSMMYMMVTHVLPGMILYLWVFIVAMIPATIVQVIVAYFVLWLVQFYQYIARMVGVRHSNGQDDTIIVYEDTQNDLENEIVFYISKFFMRLIFVTLIRTFFNYAALYYMNDGVDYIEVISKEFVLRSQLNCYLDNKFDSTLNILSFFDWL